MPRPTDAAIEPSHHVDLDVRGVVPAGLEGTLAAVDPHGVVRTVELHAGRMASYRVRHVAAPSASHRIVSFNGSLLVFGEGSCAVELSHDLASRRTVDLAGRRRALVPSPRLDPSTGELHVVARTVGGPADHVVVSAGALTRQARSIPDAPGRITDLALSPDRVVYLADGFVGVASRHREPHTTWMATGVRGVSAVHAHDSGDDIVLLALTPSLERWTLRPSARQLRRDVLDPTP